MSLRKWSVKGIEMGIYQNICYKVEDIFIKILTKKQDPAAVKTKVSNYRSEKKRAIIQRKEARTMR